MTSTATTTLLPTLTLAEYLRVSHDDSGRQRSNDEQHEENSDLIARSPGWSYADRSSYSDVGSASKFQKRGRDGYDELCSDLAAGRFEADALLLWIASRGSRKVGEWVTLLELLEEAGKKIVVTTHGGRIYDPANARDRRTLLEDAIDSEYEAAKISQSVRRALLRDAQAGKHHGGRRAYGYRGTDDQGRPDGRTIEPVEAAVIRDLVRSLLAGSNPRELAADLNAKGIPTTTGKRWHPARVAAMIASPRIAGMRTHHGRIMTNPDGSPVKVEWEPIISIDDHRRVVAVLASRSPIGRRGRESWIGTGLLRCGKCGNPMVGNCDARSTGTKAGTRRYVCRKGPGYAATACGGLVIKAADVETFLGDAATRRLADVEARRSASTDAGPEDADDLAELSRIAARRIEISDLVAGEKLEPASSVELFAALDRRQAVVEASLAAKVRKVGPLDFVAAEGYIGRTWDQLEADEKRQLLRMMIEQVEVGPNTLRPGSTRFDSSRIAGDRISWRI